MNRASILNFVKKSDEESSPTRKFKLKNYRDNAYFTTPHLFFEKEYSEPKIESQTKVLWKDLFLNMFKPYSEKKEMKAKESAAAASKRKDETSQRVIRMIITRRNKLKNKSHHSMQEKATEEFDEIYEKAHFNWKPLKNRDDFRRRSCACNKCGGECKKIEKTRFLVSYKLSPKKTVEILGIVTRAKSKMRSLYKSKSFLYKFGSEPKSPLKSKKKSLSPGPRQKSEESHEHRSFTLLPGYKSPLKRVNNSKEEASKPLNMSSTILDSQDKSSMLRKSDVILMSNPLVRPTNTDCFTNYIPVLDKSRSHTRGKDFESSILSQTERNRAFKIASENVKKKIKLIKLKRPIEEIKREIGERPATQINNRASSRNSMEGSHYFGKIIPFNSYLDEHKSKGQSEHKAKGLKPQGKRGASWHSSSNKSRKERENNVLSIYKKPHSNISRGKSEEIKERGPTTGNSTASWFTNLEDKLKSIEREKKYTILPNTKNIVMLSGRINIFHQK